MARILLVHADSFTRASLCDVLVTAGHVVAAHPCIDDIAADNGRWDLVVADRALAARLLGARRQHEIAPLFVAAPGANASEVASLFRAGVADVIHQESGSALAEALLASVARCQWPESDGRRESIPELIGNSPPMQALFAQMRKVATAESPALIVGESGTGKGLVAYALHTMSPRATAPLIVVDCGGQFATLDSALGGDHNFGRQLLAAAGGTLFLDEVGELSLEAQARLVHTLHDGDVRRLGSPRSHDGDIRLLASTHRNLRHLIGQGLFREDLYYRLQVVSLHVPPLRERDDDVISLAEAALRRTASKLGRRPPQLSAATTDTLRAYPWPGNVRELENAVERAVILCNGDLIAPELLALEPADAPAANEPASADTATTLDDYFISFVQAHQDHMTETELAARLGISRKSLWERRQRFGVPRQRTRKRGLRGAS